MIALCVSKHTHTYMCMYTCGRSISICSWSVPPRDTWKITGRETLVASNPSLVSQKCDFKGRRIKADKLFWTTVNRRKPWEGKKERKKDRIDGLRGVQGRYRVRMKLHLAAEYVWFSCCINVWVFMRASVWPPHMKKEKTHNAVENGNICTTQDPQLLAAVERGL